MSSKQRLPSAHHRTTIAFGPAAPDRAVDEDRSSAVALVDAAVLPEHSRTQLIAGRLVDLVLCVFLLIIGFIPCLLIAAMVKLTSRGPVLFTQERVGRGGVLFRLFKFRTMEQGTHTSLLADEALRSAYEDNDFKLPPDDPRITPLGRVLRKTSIDELPQLVNVLRGEMSIVGIRPLLSKEVALRPPYDQALYRLLQPGLTGLWQVEGRSTVRKTDRLALDRRYVEQWSVLGDLKIVVRTPLAVLRIHHAH